MTELVFILDRSGSMSGLEKDTIGGFNSMLEKGAIQVAGFVQSTKNYARTFTPTLTADEYAVLQFKHSSAFNEQSVLCLVSALVEDIQDQDTLAKLGDILEKRKLQLG